MSQIKVETTEDSIDEMSTSMQHLIEQADWWLSNIQNRSSNSINLSTLDDDSIISNRNSMQAYIAEQEPDSPEPGRGISIVSTSSQPNHDDGNESSGSDTTIVCGSEEPTPGPSNSTSLIIVDKNNSFVPSIIRPTVDTTVVYSSQETTLGPSNSSPTIVLGRNNSFIPGVIRPMRDTTVTYTTPAHGSTPAGSSNSTPTFIIGRNNSLGPGIIRPSENATLQPSNRAPGIVIRNNSPDQEVIVIGTPTIPHQRRRRARRCANVPNMDDSVIDLSNYPEMRPEPPTESIVVLSSDEENGEAAEVVVTAQQPPAPPPIPAANRSITINSFGFSVEASSPRSISVVLTDRRRDRNRSNESRFGHVGQLHDAGYISAVEPAPAPNHYSPPAPPSQGIANNAGSHAATEANAKTMIICPICYETLVNQRAVSTSCGHVFCSQCINLSLRTAKKCPICNKKLIRPSQLHPVYFATG